MKQITPSDFLTKVESGIVEWKGTVGRRVYGVDFSDGRKTVWADVP